MSRLFLASALWAAVSGVRKMRKTALSSSANFNVLQPSNKNLKPIGVIMNPGGTVAPDMYDEQMKLWIQEAEKKNMSMWVCTLEYWFDLSLPMRLEANVKDAKALMKKAGLPDNARFVFTGHSMGASASMPQQNKLYNEGAWEAVVLQAGYITREFYPPLSSTFTYTAPTLTITAELNFGGSRVPRAAEAFYRNRDMCRTHPVVSIEGMNHMQFAVGFEKADLKPEKETMVCLQEVAELSIDFIDQQLYNGNGNVVNAAKAKAKTFFQPFITAFELEGSRSFNEPYQVDTPGWDTRGDCPRGVCKGTSEWAEICQKHILGSTVLQKGVRVKGNFADLYPWRLGVDREDRKPFLKDNIAQIYMYAPFDSKKWKKDFMKPIANTQLAVKFVSRQNALVNVVGNANAPKDTDFCVELNQKAWDKAWSLAPTKQKTRFEKYGQKLEFVPTVYKTAGPQWVGGGLDFIANKTSGKMNVRSTGLFTEPGNRKIDGNHYCKLLTPARALEWIYVDGLEDKLMGVW